MRTAAQQAREGQGRGKSLLCLPHAGSGNYGCHTPAWVRTAGGFLSKFDYRCFSPSTTAVEFGLQRWSSNLIVSRASRDTPTRSVQCRAIPALYE